MERLRRSIGSTLEKCPSSSVHFGVSVSYQTAAWWMDASALNNESIPKEYKRSLLARPVG